MKDEFERTFNEEFGDKFMLLSHRRVLDSHLFGDNKNHDRFEEFIGDYLAIAKDKYTFAYKEKNNKTHKGQHAGMLEDELMIPVIVIKK